MNMPGEALQGPACDTAPPPDPGRIRLRAVVLGLILAVAICGLTPFNNAYRNGTPLGGGHFPLAPFFLLLVMTVVLYAAGRLLRRRMLLNGRELLYVWIIMVLVSGIAFTGLVRTFFINVTAPFYFATVGNNWENIIQPLWPASWSPAGPETIETLYNGLSGGREMSWLEVVSRIHWGDWLGPLLLWGGFVLLCYFVMICLANLFSRQWIKNERMNFPLLQVPLLMEEAVEKRQLGGFLTNQFLLAGVAVPVFLHLINGLSFYIPSIPQIPTLILAGPYFPQYGLFSGFVKLKIYLFPAFIGFAFLTSRQISFSFWFFSIVGGLIIGLLSVLGYSIPAGALGVTFGPHLTRPEETQMIGAYGVFFLFILWLARLHLFEVVKQAFGLAKPDEPGTEWVSVRFSFWGFTAGALALVVWCHHFGLPLLASFLVIGAFFMVMLVATRVICQGGIAYFTLTAAPIDGLLALFGPGFFSHVGLVVAAVVQKVLFVDLRESLMPSLFHASKVSHGMKTRRLVLSGIALALIAGVAVSFLAMLVLCYKYGVRGLQLDWATRTTVTVSQNLQNLIESPVRADRWVLAFSLVGAAVMLVLVLCYHRLFWWPIHPIGYLTAYSSAMDILWFSFFLGWLANTLCMRYGGVMLFKRLRLFFVGLIIGDFLMGGSWAIVGLFSDASYQVLPN